MSNLASRTVQRAHSASSRGERLHPSQFSRVFWVLTGLRDELIFIVRVYLRNATADRLIDYGCGNMPYRPIFESNVAKYIGCDLPGNELSDETLTDLGTLPIDNDYASIVLSSQVLEHVITPSVYLTECHRVLQSGGLLILSTHGVWRYHPDPFDLWRWTCGGLRKIIEDAGFEVLRFKGILGPEATALQVLQDAKLGRIPRTLAKIYTWYMQRLIRRADMRCTDADRDADACVYVVVARKRN